MANLQRTNISDSGFIKLPLGNTGQRPSSPSPGMIRYNSDTQEVEFYTGSAWEDFVPAIGTQDNPAVSGRQIAEEVPNAPSGYYYIQHTKMPNPLQMYVDMVEEGGGFDFYPIQGGTGVWTVFENVGNTNSPRNSGRDLGLDMWYPRSPFHWRAAVNFVSNVLGESGNNFQRYFTVASQIYRFNSNNSGTGDGRDYTNQIMRDPNSYGSGANDWQVPDGGRWWLRDSTFNEPNGDYLNWGFLSISADRVNATGGATGPSSLSGSYNISENYNLEDLRFNDIASDRHHYTGTYYLVSTNAKP